MKCKMDVAMRFSNINGNHEKQCVLISITHIPFYTNLMTKEGREIKKTEA